MYDFANVLYVHEVSGGYGSVRNHSCLCIKLLMLCRIWNAAL